MAKKQSKMTLEQLIKQLMELKKQGYGEFKVVIDDYMEVNGVSVNELKGKVSIY